MLVLYETSAGYALFKVAKPSKVLDSPDTLWEEFRTPDQASSIVKLKAFSEFQNTTDAVVAATHMIEGTLDKSLKKFLKKNIQDKEISDELAVADVKLGGLINKALDIKCIFNDAIHELYRGIRCQLDSLLGDTSEELKAMQLGLSHSLGRYKLKFTADKVDIMIVQAIGLLDDLDKEINIYAMRVREWYGWHFPEMAKIINDNVFFAKCVKRMGYRSQCKLHDFSDILGDELVEETLKRTAETSMGTEISDMDLMNITSLCDQVISLTEYRLQLYEYLKNRMAAIAPNLTLMVGELVGARLIAHAGSLLNLAKHPASTIQILGAEKALFRALKTKHDTPKYGLIYHASLIGQAAPKNKGKISRVLAAKTALAIRVDAMGDAEGPTIAIENKMKVENRLRQLEGGQKVVMGSGNGNGASKYDAVAARALAPPKFNDASDIIVDHKRKRDDDSSSSAKKGRSDGVQMFASSGNDDNDDVDDDGENKKKKKKKDKRASSDNMGDDVEHDDVERSQKKKKDKKNKD